MQRPKPTGKAPSEDDDEPQELARFRREWVAELQKKTDIHSAAPTSYDPTNVTQPPIAVNPRWEPWSTSAAPQNYPGPSSRTITGQPSALSNVSISSSSIERGAAPLPRTVSSALNVYRQAVEHEQRGELDDALLLYRQAFRTVRRVY
jgi:F-box protein 9